VRAKAKAAFVLAQPSRLQQNSRLITDFLARCGLFRGWRFGLRRGARRTVDSVDAVGLDFVAGIQVGQTSRLHSYRAEGAERGIARAADILVGLVYGARFCSWNTSSARCRRRCVAPRWRVIAARNRATANISMPPSKPTWAIEWKDGSRGYSWT